MITTKQTKFIKFLFMENGKGNNKDDIKDKIINLYKLGEKRVNSIKDKEEKFLKHITEINQMREKLRSNNKWKIPKLIITLVIIGIGIFIMFMPERSIIGKNIFEFSPPETLKIDINKYTVINFFASWCDTCEEELPELVNLQSNHSNISVIGVAVQDSIEKIEELAKKYEINYQIIYDPDGKFAKNLGIDAVPTTLIVSEDSKIQKIIYGPTSAEKIVKTIQKIEKTRAEKSKKDGKKDG